MPKCYTPSQVAEQLGVDVSKVLAWLRRGELVGHRLPHRGAGKKAGSGNAPFRWRISEEAIQEFLAATANVKRPAAEPAKSSSRRSRKPTAVETAGPKTWY